MKRVSFLSQVLTAGLLCLFPAMVGGQEPSQPLPDNWRELPLATFVGEVDSMLSGEDPPTPDSELWQEVSKHAAQLLMNALDTGAAADYHDLVNLYLWGNADLTAEQRETALAGLSPPADQVSGWTFDKMRSAHVRMNQATMPQASREALVVAWLEDRDLATLDDLGDTGWLYERVHHIKADTVKVPEFSVQWTGFIQATGDGEYTFSICPIDLNFKHRRESRQQTMALWIADRQVLDSTKDGWTVKSDPVALAAGQKTPIRVELSYKCSGDDLFEDRPAIAILVWEGPGMTKRVVPSSAFSPPEGDGNGLKAEYRLVENGQQRTVSRIDPNIDQIWYRGPHIAPDSPDLRPDLADRLWVLATDPDTFADWEKIGAAREENWLGAAPWFLQSLSSPRHKTFLDELLARPALLESVSRRGVLDLYGTCRFGAPDRALELFGAWAHMNPDAVPDFGPKFYDTNRAPFRGLSTNVEWQYLPHFDALETRYLELADGGCSLPVAYTLAYSYWVQGRIYEWMQKLKARLDDEQLTGDRRVNWLLARAQAESIRRSQPGRQWLTFERTMAGYGWLQETCLVAQSEPARLRAYKELAVRLAADDRVDAAGKMLDAAAERCSAPESVEKIAAWRTELAGVAEQLAQLYKRREAAAQQNYINAVRQRHSKAVDRGDQDAAARYERILSDSGATIE